MPLGTAKLSTTVGNAIQLPVPNAPTVTATTGGTSTLNLSWTNVSTLHQVRVYRDTTLLTTLPAGSTSYQATGLSANTSYTFSLRYFNGVQEGTGSQSASRKTAPNPPTSVSAQGLSTTAVRISWSNAHSDVTTRASTGGGVAFGTAIVGATSIDRTGLSQGTTYSFYVEHANSEGTYSAASATVNGTTLLTAPSNLSVTSTTTSSVSLSWTNGSSSHQTRVYRNSSLVVQLANTGVTTYTDTGLSSATSYLYYVVHLNVDGTLSGQSNTVTGTTVVNPPSSLTASVTGTTSISLSWTNGTSSFQTEVYRGGSLIATVAAGTSTYSSTSLSANTQYSYQVRHTNGTLTSSLSNTATATTNPNAPTSLTATFVSGSQVNLAWTNSHSLTTYIYRGGSFVTSVSAGVSSFSDNVPTLGQSYSYTVRHFNSSTSALSADSNTASVSVPQAAPTAPTSLSATASSTSQIGLSWTNTDAAAQIRVYRNSSLLTTLSAGTTTYSDTGLPSATQYTYYVVHFKNSLESTASNNASATTLLSAPTNLTAIGANSSQITLSWSNTDSGAETRIYRGGSLVTTLLAGVNAYTDSNRPANSQFSYTVRHFKNSVESANSTTASAWTYPSPPVSLTATAASASQINLAWTNSHSLQTYIYLNGNFLTSVSAGVTSYAHTGLSSGTTYNYTVRHYNSTSGFMSTNSNQASATTQTAVPSVVITSVYHDNLFDTVTVSFNGSNAPSGSYYGLTWYTEMGFPSFPQEKFYITNPVSLNIQEHGYDLVDFGSNYVTFYLTVTLYNNSGTPVASAETTYTTQANNQF
jgi:hypothetical protein